jgi:ribosomal protein S18 acetylase RimI-like enzyme
MDKPTIRQAVLADLDDLASLFDGYRQFYGQASDVEGAHGFLRERLHHGQSVLFIARDGSAPAARAVGFTQLYPSFSSVSMAHTFVLNDLFVAPGHRRHGLGARLLHAAADHAQALGAVRLTLSTAHDNLAAQSVYRAQGWQRDERFQVYHLALSR